LERVRDSRVPELKSQAEPESHLYLMKVCQLLLVKALRSSETEMVIEEALYQLSALKETIGLILSILTLPVVEHREEFQARSEIETEQG